MLRIVRKASDKKEQNGSASSSNNRDSFIAKGAVSCECGLIKTYFTNGQMIQEAA
jgi:hypothetical protein